MNSRQRRELEDAAHFRVGDTVLLNGLEPWMVIGRYYRRSAKQIVYEVECHIGAHPYRIRIEQARLTKPNS